MWSALVIRPSCRSHLCCAASPHRLHGCAALVDVQTKRLLRHQREGRHGGRRRGVRRFRSGSADEGASDHQRGGGGGGGVEKNAGWRTEGFLLEWQSEESRPQVRGVKMCQTLKDKHICVSLGRLKNKIFFLPVMWCYINVCTCYILGKNYGFIHW